MTNKVYTEQEVEDFIELASVRGIAPSIRALGYPTFPTAQRWFRDKGLDMPTIDSLMAKAAEMKIYYGDNEKKYAAQILIDRIVEKLQEDDLDADGVNKLANALNKAIQTFNLIEGKSTSITETHTKDGVDLGAMDLINAAKARNSLKESQEDPGIPANSPEIL